MAGRTMAMYERLQDDEEDRAAAQAPEARDTARQAARASNRRNLAFISLIVSNIVTLLVALFFAQKLFLAEAAECKPDSPEMQGQPLGQANFATDGR